MSILVLFIYHVIKLFHAISGSEAINAWVTNFPSSLQKVHIKVIGSNITFINYVVCSKCHSLHNYEDCIEISGSTRTSRKCPYVQFPNHNRQSCRHACGAPLLRTVKKNSATSFKPYKTYSYQSLKDAAARLLKRNGFLRCVKNGDVAHLFLAF